MKIKPGEEENWKKAVEVNSDGYGLAIMRYALRWAELMEEGMAAGEKLEDIALETSHKADIDGITGFMYGAAVGMLAWAWEHGDALRRHHNLETQLDDEGEKANESGGTLNPAILEMGEPE